MHRKFITFITILALLISALLPVQLFAEEDIGYEGRICRDLGILKGETGVVDNDYLETRPSRLQAAIMFLRLKGLEQEALSYNGADNFKDAGTIAWKEGRNVLSYLKEHPQLGWIGDGVNFMPYNLIDSRAYYKVLLECLGYRQKIDGDGDFDWNSVLDFAEEKGLYKVAGTKNFTVRSLAIATVEALQTKMKNSNKKLIDYLVENGEVDRRIAISLGLYSDSIEAEVKYVRAISNSKVEVVFEEPVGSEAADEDLYTIKGLSIKDVNLKGDNAVIIDTSAMNENSNYTLVFNDESYSFKGLKKDTQAPKLIKAECKDTDLVELTFDRVLDNKTAQDPDTYSIEGVEVKSAKLDSTNTKVWLITDGIQSGRSYELKIRNIKNGDGVTTKLITKRFTGRKDTTAPKLNKLTVLNNVKLLLEFTDANGLDKATAQDVDNYRITYSGGSLDVISAQVKDRDGDGLWDSVELLTESQEPGRAYTLIIEDIADDSVLGNRISKAIKKDFRGKSKDRTGPTIARNPKAITNTMVEVVFSDSNALDIQSACDMDNYELDDDLELIDIRIKDPDNLYSEAGRTVLLITSEMEKSKSYTLVISGVQDEFGNELKSSGSKVYKFRGVAADRTPPYITYVECIDSRTIELNFDNTLDEKSAENILNYRIDGLALVTKAVLKEDGKTVVLTVSSLPSDRNHTILLNNIADLSGNKLSNVSVSVYYNGSLYDDDPPEVDYIEAVNEKEVWVHFSEEVYAENARMEASGIDFKQVGNVLNDGTTVVMKADKNMHDKEYEVESLAGIWDLAGNPYEYEYGLEFYGTDIENEPPEVEYWDQTDVRTFRVVFTEPVLLKASEMTVSGITWNLKLNPDGGDTNEAYSTVELAAKNNIPPDKTFKFDFTKAVTDYMGLGAMDEEDDGYGDSGCTVLESYMEDDEDPYIEYVEAITRNKVQVVFNEAMSKPGSYKITYEDDDYKIKEIDIDFVEVDAKDRTRVNIFTEDLLSDEYIYVLEPKSTAVDIAGNRLDIDGLEIEFAGTNVMSSDYIQGVEILNANTLRVTKNSRIDKVNYLYELDEDGDAIVSDLIKDKSRINDNVYKIVSEKPLLRDVRYEISVDGLKYKFYGGVPNGDIELDVPGLEITYDGINPDKHYVEVNNKAAVFDNNKYCFVIKDGSIKNGDILYIYVKRKSDNEIIYGTRIKVEGMPTTKASSSKEITSFKIKDLDAEVKIDNESNTITIVLPSGTNLKKLTPLIETSAYATVEPASEIERDFSGQVDYKVTAQDGSVRNYKVYASVRKSSDNYITSFGFEGVKTLETIIKEGQTNSISIKVPNNTDITSLTPVIEISEDAEIHPQPEEKDFTNPRTYTVTAQDGSKREYTVTVLVAPSSEKVMKKFGFDIPGTVSVINEDSSSISVKVPYGTKLNGLKAVFSSSDHSKVVVGRKSQVSGETPNNFNKPVTYTVVAQDGTKRNYTVTVTAAAIDEKYLAEFSFAGLNPPVKGRIDQRKGTITISVPDGTDLTNLAASFAYIGKAVEVKSEADGEELWIPQVSGKTTNDFSKPVVYRVIAHDDTAKEYEVTVNILKPEE